VAKAKASDDQAVIAHQELQIAELTRQLYGRHRQLIRPSRERRLGAKVAV